MTKFSKLAKLVHDGRNSKVCDSSERRHLFEFLADVVSNVDYDCQSGNYKDEDPGTVLEQQLVGCLDELIEQARQIREEIAK